MKTLVTGGAGFIGSHVTDALLQAGHEVAVIDNLATGVTERLADNVSFYNSDIRDIDAVRGCIDQVEPEVIFHLAAQADVRVSVADPVADAAINILGAVNVLTSAQPHNARVIFASTGGAIYGETTSIPTSEKCLAQPQSPYGTAKLCAEHYLQTFNTLYDSKHCAIRFGNVFGPRQNPDAGAGVISIYAGLVSQGKQPLIFGDGTQTRDYIYVSDVVDAMILAAQSPNAGVWNIGTGVETSMLDLVAAFEKATGRSLEPEFSPSRVGEVQRSCLDPSLAMEQLGFTVQVPFVEGVERVYRWILDGSSPRAKA